MLSKRKITQYLKNKDINLIKFLLNSVVSVASTLISSGIQIMQDLKTDMNN